MSDPVAEAIREHAAATRENTELLRQIAGALFEIAGQGGEDEEEGERRRDLDGNSY